MATQRGRTRVLFFASPEGAQFKGAQSVLWLRVSRSRRSGKESEVSHIAPEDCRKKERESQARACRQSACRMIGNSVSYSPSAAGKCQCLIDCVMHVAISEPENCGSGTVTARTVPDRPTFTCVISRARLSDWSCLSTRS